MLIGMGVKVEEREGPGRCGKIKSRDKKIFCWVPLLPQHI